MLSYPSAVVIISLEPSIVEGCDVILGVVVVNRPVVAFDSVEDDVLTVIAALLAIVWVVVAVASDVMFVGAMRVVAFVDVVAALLRGVVDI